MFGPLEVQPFASQIYGLYTGLVYFTPLIGGLIADRLLGQRRTVIIGAVLMAIGHFMMAFESLFLLALLMLILGNGAFKPNISTQVGGLYAPGDHRRDRAYSIFYVGINVGAALGPFICGTLGKDMGLWHYGFSAAGVGMCIALVVYLHALPMLPTDEMHKVKAAGLDKRPLDRDEWRSVLALIALFIPTMLFWATYEQQGNTIALWADTFTDRTIDLYVWHGEIPATWFQSFNPLMIFAFTPLVIRLWSWQERRGTEPSTVTKMALGCFGVAVSYLIMAGAAWSANGDEFELAVAARLFRRPHLGRALSVADRAVAGLEGGAAAPPLDDDGTVAWNELPGQPDGRLARQLLEQHEQDQLLPDARRHRRLCRRGDLRVQPAPARHAGQLIVEQRERSEP